MNENDKEILIQEELEKFVDWMGDKGFILPSRKYGVLSQYLEEEKKVSE